MAVQLMLDFQFKTWPIPPNMPCISPPWYVLIFTILQSFVAIPNCYRCINPVVHNVTDQIIRRLLIFSLKSDREVDMSLYPIGILCCDSLNTHFNGGY